MTSLAFVAGRPAPPEPGSATERIVDATLRCVARWGITKTTVDDVAREAGVGRATLYRQFPGGRDALLDAVVAAEAARFFARLDACVSVAGSLEDLLVVMIGEAARTLADHAAFQFLLAHEPETILPHLTFQQMDVVLRTVAVLGSPYLIPWLDDPDEEAAARAVEWIARIVISYLIAPSPGVNLAEPDSIRQLVRTYIVPGLTPERHRLLEGEPV